MEGSKAKKRRIETEEEDEESDGDDDDDQQHKVMTTMEGIETTLFFIGLFPYKLVLQMEQTNKVTLSDVRAVATSQSIALPDILQSSSGLFHHPRGHFVVRSNRDLVNSRQYGFFKHKNTTGCSLASSSLHERFLREPMLRHKDSLARPATLKLRVGSKFFYDQEFSYEFDDEGRMKMDIVGFGMPATSRSDQVEDQRKFQLMEDLRANLKGYKVTLVHDSSRYCPFTGGGDIWVYKNHDRLVILDEAGRDSEDEDGSCSPRAKGEYRCPASIENKVITGISEMQKEAVTKQLQANMVLTATHFLCEKIKMCPADAKAIESVTTYGLQMGIFCPVKVLKLTLNFRTATSSFEELFSKERCPFSHIFIDTAVANLVSSSCV